MSRLTRTALVALLLWSCGDDPDPSKVPAWKRPVSGVFGKVSRFVRRHLPGEETPGPSPRHPPGSVWIEPTVAGPDTALTCLLDGAPAPDAAWTLDGAPAGAGPTFTQPRGAGAIVTCTAGGVASHTVAIHDGALPSNVLFILLDDVGVQDVSAYGIPGSAATPHIDRLAAEGVRFERAWSEPVCSPTRASLMAGLHPMNHGLGIATAEFGDGTGLDDRSLSVADVARARGVGATGVFGKWHVGSSRTPDDHPARLGFTHAVITPGNVVAEGEDYFHYELVRDGVRGIEDGYLPSATMKAASEFIREQQGPWFAWIALNLAHAPYHDPPADLIAQRHKDERGAKYAAMVEAADVLIGKLLDSMAPEVLARTVIIVMGDNGTPEFVARDPLDANRAKSTVYEGGVRVPLIVWGPSIRGGGRVIETPVGAVDFLPTVAELFGRGLDTAEAEQVDGNSFADVLWSDRVPRDGRSIFTEIFGPNTHDERVRKNHRRAITDGRFKLITSPEGEELYDLRDDPWERHDLIKRGVTPPPALDRLRGLLQTRYIQRPWPRPEWEE